MTPHPTPGPGKRPIEVRQWPAHLARVRQCKEMMMDGWISVEDRLPKTHEEVLVFAKGLVRTGHLYGRISTRGKQWWAVGNGHSTAVTHWMPLPEPPQTAVTEAQR